MPGGIDVRFVQCGSTLFRYNRRQWWDLCERVDYFAELKTAANEPLTVNLEKVGANIFRHIDDFAKSGTFGIPIDSGHFGAVLEAVESLRVNEADEELAGQVDRGEVFYVEARRAARVSGDDDDAFLKCAELLWDSRRFSEFANVRRAFRNLVVFLENHYDLFKRLPDALFKELNADADRAFGLERDVFRATLSRCEHAGSFKLFFRLTRDVRVDWPPLTPGRLTVFGVETHRKLDTVAERLIDRWLDGDQSQFFFESEYRQFEDSLDLFADDDGESRRPLEDILGEESDATVAEGSGDIDGLVSAGDERSFTAECRRSADDDESERMGGKLRRLLVDVTKKMACRPEGRQRRPRYRPSMLVNTGDRLYEYHPYVRRFRLLSLNPNDGGYFFLPHRSSGVWLLRKRPIKREGGSAYCFPAAYMRYDQFGHLSEWDEPARLADDITEQSLWRWTDGLPASADANVVVSNGSVDSDPLVFVRQNDQRWTGFFLGAGTRRGSFALEGFVDIRSSHVGLEATKTRLFVIQFFESRQPNLGVYDIEGDSSSLQLRLLCEICLPPSANPATLEDRDGVNLACTGRGKPVIFRESVIKTGSELTVRYATRSKGRWKDVELKICDVESTTGLDTYRLWDFSVASTPTSVIIRNFGEGAFNAFDGRQVVVDAINETGFVERLFPALDGGAPEADDDEVWTAWKAHRPLTRELLPRGDKLIVTDRASVPSSRLGFWVDLELVSRSDEHDPYDFVNWNVVKKKAICDTG